MASRLRLGSDCVEYVSIHPLRPVALRRTCSSWSHSDVDRNGTGHLETDNLPAVDVPWFAELGRPERRRFYIVHPTGDGRSAIAVGDVKRRFGDGATADAGGVHKCFVREVHEVV